MSTLDAALAPPRRETRAWAMVAGAALLWWLPWRTLLPLAAWLAYDVLGLAHGSKRGEAVAFCLHGMPKMLSLLGVVAAGIVVVG